MKGNITISFVALSIAMIAFIFSLQPKTISLNSGGSSSIPNPLIVGDPTLQNGQIITNAQDDGLGNYGNSVQDNLDSATPYGTVTSASGIDGYSVNASGSIIMNGPLYLNGYSTGATFIGAGGDVYMGAGQEMSILGDEDTIELGADGSTTINFSSGGNSNQVSCWYTDTELGYCTTGITLLGSCTCAL